MKVLFVSGASPATLFAHVPLAQALRNAGHEVLLATTEEMTSVGETCALPFVTVTDRTIAGLLSTDRDGAPVPEPVGLEEELRYAGGWFGRLAAACLDGLVEVSRHWRPDLVVGGTMCYAAALLAARLGVPHIRLAWDAQDCREVHPLAEEELAPEVRALGLTALPEPALFLDICPPGLRHPTAPPARMTRWVPGNAQRALEPWMYTGSGRPRVCVTSGSRSSVSPIHDFLSELVADLAGLDAEVLVAAPEADAGALRERFPGLRVGWMPLDVLAPTCDLVVHHGGGVTALTALAAGRPQLVLPRWSIFGDSWRRIGASGAGITLFPDEATSEAVAKGCRELLTEPSYSERAGDLSAQMAAMPSPAEQVPVLEALGGR